MKEIEEVVDNLRTSHPTLELTFDVIHEACQVQTQNPDEIRGHLDHLKFLIVYLAELFQQCGDTCRGIKINANYSQRRQQLRVSLKRLDDNWLEAQAPAIAFEEKSLEVCRMLLEHN